MEDEARLLLHILSVFFFFCLQDTFKLIARHFGEQLQWEFGIFLLSFEYFFSPLNCVVNFTLNKRIYTIFPGYWVGPDAMIVQTLI